MKEIIEQLRTLNEIDVRIGIVNKDVERLPRELAEKQAPIKSLAAAIERAKADILKLKIDADSADLDVKAGEEALKRLANQMNILKTTKEFDTIRRQMDAQRGWNKENDEKELKLLEQVEAKQKEIEKNQAALAELELSSGVEAQRIEKELSELGARIEELTAERNKLAPEIPDKELAIYSRIANRGVVAIAFVKNGNCSLCYMRLPAQFQNLALIGRELVCCPSCGRILTAEKKQ